MATSSRGHLVAILKRLPLEIVRTGHLHLKPSGPYYALASQRFR